MSRRNASRRSSSSAGKPAWVWFVLGNFVGGFVVFIIFLQGLKQDGIPPVTADSRPAAERAEETSTDKPEFDFYTLLKENEVSVPPPKTPRLEPRGNTESASGEAEPETEPAAAPARAGSKFVYILQAAAFHNAEDAERLRARLTLANLDVKIETATDSRGTWHRVLIGPYTSRSAATGARAQLAEHDLMALMLKRPAK